MRLLLSIDVSQIYIPALALLGVGLVFAVLIVYLSRVLSVEKDVKEADVRSCLPGANCGACGKAGCDDFAGAVVHDGADPTLCTQLTKEKAQKIGEIMGLSMEGVVESIYVVGCMGGKHCKDKYDYIGYGDCKSNELLSGGSKACEFGCMGKTSCAKACPYYAVDVCADGYSVTDPDKCKACGLCAKECPKGIIKKIPKSADVYLACSNKNRGKDITSVCSVGCIGCGLCARACPNGAIVMVDNLPVIDYSKCTNCYACVAKCPRKVLVRVRPEVAKQEVAEEKEVAGTAK